MNEEVPVHLGRVALGSVYERMLEALEDAEDAASFDEAIVEEGTNIPWAQVKAKLGWA